MTKTTNQSGVLSHMFLLANQIAALYQLIYLLILECSIAMVTTSHDQDNQSEWSIESHVSISQAECSIVSPDLFVYFRMF